MQQERTLLIYDWYDRAMEQLDKDHEQGYIDDAEYQRSMRDLNSEYDEWAREKYPDNF